MLFWYIVDTFMARIVSCLTPGFNNYFEKLLVVSACGIATYVRSRRREMRFRKYKMVEVQGIEPWSERVPLGSSPSKLLYTPKWGEVCVSSSFRQPKDTPPLPFPVGYTLSFTSRSVLKQGRSRVMFILPRPVSESGEGRFQRSQPSPIYLGDALGSFVGSRSSLMTPWPRILSREQASKVFVSLQRGFGLQCGAIRIQVGK